MDEEPGFKSVPTDTNYFNMPLLWFIWILWSGELCCKTWLWRLVAYEVIKSSRGGFLKGLLQIQHSNNCVVKAVPIEEGKSFLPWPTPCLSSALKRKLIVLWEAAGAPRAFNIASAAPRTKPKPNKKTTQIVLTRLKISASPPKDNKGKKAGKAWHKVLYYSYYFLGGWGSCSARYCVAEMLFASCSLQSKISEPSRSTGLCETASALFCISSSRDRWVGAGTVQVCRTKPMFSFLRTDQSGADQSKLSVSTLVLEAPALSFACRMSTLWEQFDWSPYEQMMKADWGHLAEAGENRAWGQGFAACRLCRPCKGDTFCNLQVWCSRGYLLRTCVFCNAFDPLCWALFSHTWSIPRVSF